MNGCDCGDYCAWCDEETARAAAKGMKMPKGIGKHVVLESWPTLGRVNTIYTGLKSYALCEAQEHADKLRAEDARLHLTIRWRVTVTNMDTGKECFRAEGPTTTNS